MNIKITPENTRLVDIGDLKPNPKNPNKHSAAQIERLCQLITYQGFRQPIIVSNQSGLIVVGHGRLEAAKKLGFTKLPTSYQDFSDETEEYNFMVSDNAISAWSELDLSAINTEIGELGPFDIDLLGIEGFTVTPVEKVEPQCGEDDVPGISTSKVNTVLGYVYQLGAHRLMCGDSTSIDAVEKLMNGEKSELCFTSPPYADQRDYNGEKELSTEHLATFIRAAYGKVNYFAVNLGYSRKNGEVNPYWDDYIKEAKDCGLIFLSWNIWDRGSAFSIGQQTAMFPIENEWIFVFGEKTKDLNTTVPNKHAGEKTGVTNRQADGSLVRKASYGIREFRELGTICRIGVDRNRSIDHPAKFPVELPEEQSRTRTIVFMSHSAAQVQL